MRGMSSQQLEVKTMLLAVVIAVSMAGFMIGVFSYAASVEKPPNPNDVVAICHMTFSNGVLTINATASGVNNYEVLMTELGDECRRSGTR